MPRGYWRIIVAAVGWLALSGQHPSPPTKPQQAATDPRVGEALQNIAAEYHQEAERVRRTPQRPPCGPGKYESDDDLCAQWKAADAAKTGAWLSGASFVAVLIALFLAFQSNRIARKSSEQQLRAYITVEPQGVNEVFNEEVRVPLLIKNVGQTPAHSVMVFSKIGLSQSPRTENPKQFADGLIAEASDAVIGPGTQRYIYPYVGADFLKEHFDDIFAKRFAIMHYGYVSYRDAFNEPRETHFAFYHWGEELSDVEAKRCSFGNQAT